jgi:HK97 family phage major capsid protein
MEDILALQEEKSHLVRSAEDILNKAENEGRILSEDEKNASAALLSNADKVNKRIEEIQDHEMRASKIRDEADKLRARGQRQTPAPQPNADPRASQRPQVVIPSARYSALQAYKGEGGVESAYRVGQWLIAKFAPPDSPLKFRAERFCREQGVYDGIQNALSTSGSANSLVPNELSQTIIDLRETYGIFRQWADVVPMSSDHQIIPVQTGIGTASFIGEGITLENIESDPTYTDVSVTAHKLAAMTRMSIELSDDAVVNMADRVTRDMAYAFALKEDQVGFNGTGISTDGGITGLITKLESGSYGASFYEPSATHDNFSELTNGDLTAVMGQLPQYARAGAAWFCSQVAADTVFGALKAAGGGNTQADLAMAGISALGQKGVVGSYLGYPIVTSQVLPSVDASAALNNKVMLLFGNLRLAAVLGERRAITLASSDQRYWEKDQIAIKATARLDINIHSLGSASVAGPIIGLKGSTS